MQHDPPIFLATDTSSHPIVWNEPPKSPQIPSDEVHLWQICLKNNDAGDAGSELLVLSSDEKNRAARFHFMPDRRRFAAARAGLRCILARYLNSEPGSIAFGYGQSGKPFLPAAQSLQFNLSHSDDLAIVAVSGRRPVGVDIERVDREIDYIGIAARVFAPTEARNISNAPTTQGRQMFHRHWTRMEAVCKAHGVGLTGLSMPESYALMERCCDIHELVPASGYVGALAILRNPT